MLQLLPLAVGAIAPTLIGLVLVFLSTERGLPRAWAFILGKYAASLFWGLLFLAFASHLTRTYAKSTRPVALIIDVILGGFLLILAIHLSLGADDPDRPPPKVMAFLDKMGPGLVFLANLLWSLLQFRFVALLFVGGTVIAVATLPVVPSALLLLLLAFLMIWPLLIPVGMFLAIGEHREDVMRSMRGWMERHRRLINIIILGVFGLGLLAIGLFGLLEG